MIRWTLSLLALLSVVTSGNAADKENKLFEMRVYYAAKGKLDALNARFRDHTLKLFEKHGITNVGYWVPVENPDERLVYVISHKDKAAADQSWKDFIADPVWKKAHAESEKDGKLVAKIERFWMSATDYSHATKSEKSDGKGVYELRMYIATPHNLEHLNARFRDHTVKLFEKHGMSNVAYWNLAAADKTTCGQVITAMSPAGTPAVDVDEKSPATPLALIYVLHHDSTDAAKKSFDTFRMDADWVKARDASEKKAGGSLTAKNGVKSLMMKATDYSPLK